MSGAAHLLLVHWDATLTLSPACFQNVLREHQFIMESGHNGALPRNKPVADSELRSSVLTLISTLVGYFIVASKI